MKDSEETTPSAYLGLDAAVAERGPLAGQLEQRLLREPGAAGTLVEQVVLDALHSVSGVPRDQCRRLANERLANKPLLLYDTARAGTIRRRRAAVAERKQQRKLPNPSAATRRKHRDTLLVAPTATMSYAGLSPLRALWRAYALDLVRSGGSFFEAQSRVAHADLHGAIVRVVQSRCPALVGIEGTVVQETATLFKLATPSDRCRDVPKPGSIFAVKITDDAEILLYGNNICQRPAERAAKRMSSGRTVFLP